MSRGGTGAGDVGQDEVSSGDDTADQTLSGITAVVLAAGTSRRMGEPKLLLPWGATTVLGQTLANLRASRMGDILVVTGRESEAVARIAEAQDVRAIHNPAWSTGGMIASLQAGVRAVGPDCRAVLVVLADQPMIGADVFDAVVAVVAAAGPGGGERRIVAAAHRGRRGHPVLFGRAFFDEILALPADSAPRAILDRHPDVLRLVEVGSDAVLRDLDTVEAYERWRPKNLKSPRKSGDAPKQ